MPVLSDSILAVILPSGNRAVYSVQPQHMNPTHHAWTLNQSAIEYGTQLAVQIAGQWYKPGAKILIDDLRTIALLERASEA